MLASSLVAARIIQRRTMGRRTFEMESLTDLTKVQTPGSPTNPWWRRASRLESFHNQELRPA